jgi:hypothetical protein
LVVTQENVAVTGSRRLSSQEIAEVLRDRIQAGELKAGDRLPTQAELAEEFGVERGAVRQALRTLQELGLLTNVSKGSPPRIAERRPGSGEPRPTMVGLAPRLAQAFQAPAVRIDAICLTAETLMLALAEPLRLVHEGRVRPESIDVRILVPSRNINLAFPVPVEGRRRRADGDLEPPDPVHEWWLAQRNAQGHVLRHNLRMLRHSHGVDVRVTFRALPFTPPMKLYLLNGSEALMAYYMITRREETVGESEAVEVFDGMSAESLLFSFERAGASRDAAFVEQSQKWFDALWETITSDLTLS